MLRTPKWMIAAGVVLVADTVAPLLQKRRTLKELSNRMKRQAAKKPAAIWRTRFTISATVCGIV